MKKILLSAALMVAAVSFASAQQWFVGGSAGFMQSKNTLDINQSNIWGSTPLNGKVETTRYTIMPKFGYIFNESWMMGLGLGYAHTTEKDVSKTNMFVANPYIRLTAWQLGRFSLAFQGNVQGAMGDQKPDGGEKTKVYSAGVNIVPVVQFDLSCSVMLESRFNFAQAGWSWTKMDYPGGAKRKATGYGIGVDADDAFTTGDIEVGFIVKF